MTSGLRTVKNDVISQLKLWVSDIQYTEDNNDWEAATDWADRIERLSGDPIGQIAKYVNENRLAIENYLDQHPFTDESNEFSHKIYFGLFWLLDHKGLLE